MQIKQESISCRISYLKIVQFYVMGVFFFVFISLITFLNSDNKLIYHAIPLFFISILALTAIYYFLTKKDQRFFDLNSNNLTLFNSNKPFEIDVNLVEAVYVGDKTINPNKSYGQKNYSPIFAGEYRSYMNSPIIFKIKVNQTEELNNFIGPMSLDLLYHDSIYVPFIYSKPETQVKSQLITTLKRLLETTPVIEFSNYESIDKLPVFPEQR